MHVCQCVCARQLDKYILQRGFHEGVSSGKTTTIMKEDDDDLQKQMMVVITPKDSELWTTATTADRQRHPALPLRWTTPDCTQCLLSACTMALRYILQFGPGRPHRPTLRQYSLLPSTMYPHLLLLVLCASTVFRIAEACSSRSTPKPRPTSPTMRPNITFQTYACPEAYAKWYCLNGATCFAVKIRDSILYNCECADGYMGQRCEFKDLDGSYLPSRERVMIETASIAGGVTIAVLLVVLISLTLYIHIRRRWRKERKSPYYPELVSSKNYVVRASLHAPYRLYPTCPAMDPELGKTGREIYSLPPEKMKPCIATICTGSAP